MSQVIRNDGVAVAFPESATGKTFLLKNSDGTESRTEIGGRGPNSVLVTSDYRVEFGGYWPSEPQDRDYLVSVLSELGFVFEEDNPRLRVQPLRNEHGELQSYSWREILEMVGFKDPSRHSEGFEISGGLVFLICNGRRHPGVAPVLAREVRREAYGLIAAANRWLHLNLRSFKRAVKLSPYEAVDLYMHAKNKKVEVIEVKLGDTVEVPWQGHSYFGSGGVWGDWTVYGQVSSQEGKYKDSGFARSGTRFVTFENGPAVLYTAGGDRINGGRIFFRKLYVVSPTSDLAARAASSK